MRAGDLRERIALEKRSDVPQGDGYGNTRGGWVVQCTVWASLTPLRRGETVLASRLQGVQPYVVRIRHSSETRAVQTAWRLRDVHSGRVFNIRTVEIDPKREFIELLVDEGANNG